MVAGPDKSYFWILSRTRQLPKATLEALIEKAKQLGFGACRGTKLFFASQGILPVAQQINTMKNSLNINHARVLLVENRKNLALAVGAYLESCGFTMDYAYDGLCGPWIQLRSAIPVLMRLLAMTQQKISYEVF